MARPKLLSARARFASNLREARRSRGLSQEALGDLAGLHMSYVGAVERGERNISLDNMEKLSAALGLDLIDLLSPQPASKSAGGGYRDERRKEKESEHDV